MNLIQDIREIRWTHEIVVTQTARIALPVEKRDVGNKIIHFVVAIFAKIPEQNYHYSSIVNVLGTSLD